MSSEKDRKQQLPSENYPPSPRQTEAPAVAAGPKGFYPQVEDPGSTPEAYGEEVSEKEKAKWGTRIMGAPSAPSAHPLNQEAAMWKTSYVLNKDDTPPKNSRSPMEVVLERFNKWTKKAENLASNVWTNLKTGTSVPNAAWGKLSLGAKALTEGGFEALFKQTFSVDPNEKLRKTYACYLSTSTGPVAGTLYISTHKIAFCSDRPLSFKVPSGEEGWSYYRVAIPLANVKSVKSSVIKENPAQKYIQIVTVDYHQFWFMGFVNYDKALSTLDESVTIFQSSAQPVTV